MSEEVLQKVLVEKRDIRLKGVTWRSLLISLILMPFNAFWIMQMELVWYSGHPTTISLFFNVIYIMTILIGLNWVVKRAFPGRELSPQELLVIYVMLSLASAVAGHDFIQVLLPALGHAFWFASPENQWQSLFHRYIPKWLTVSDMTALRGYYEGGSSLYLLRNLLPWILPVSIWVVFISVLFLGFLAINSLLRKEWIENEKLSYPVVALPLQLARSPGSLFSDRMFRIAFLLVAVIDIVNTIHVLYPPFPAINVRRRDIGYLFTERPWSAIGGTGISFYPCAIGLGFFMPVDLIFSCWFFYLFWKFERVIGAIGGWEGLPGFPYIDRQTSGAYIALGIIAIWLSRAHIRTIWRRLISKNGADDSKEPMGYRSATGILALSFLFFMAFSLMIGMSIPVALVFYIVYMLISISITRMRAELGPPAHDLHFAGPDQLMAYAIGTKHLGPRNLTAFSYYFWFNRAYRGHPMAHSLEGFKLAERTGIDNKGLALAQIVAVVMGSIAAFWALLHLCYIHGAGTKMYWPITAAFGWEPFNRLTGWLQNPEGFRAQETIFTIIGFLFAFFLMAMRVRFISWPFHPVGFAVSGSWSMDHIWLPLFIAWLAKTITMRYGGIGAYRKASPFFFGLIMGDFVIGGSISMLALLLGRPLYPFWP
jgi:hypothetical protein